MDEVLCVRPVKQPRENTADALEKLTYVVIRAICLVEPQTLLAYLPQRIMQTFVHRTNSTGKNPPKVSVSRSRSSGTWQSTTYVGCQDCGEPEDSIFYI